MLEKGLKIGMGLFGVAFGIQLADACSIKSDPKLLTLGKEATGGAIFGLAGMNAGKELYSMIPKKGE